MNPSSDQIASIKTYVAAMTGAWTNTDDQIRASMQADLVANPVAQATVAKPFTLTSLLGALSSASQANLNSVPGQQQLILDIRANDIAACEGWIEFLAATAKITTAEAGSLQAIVTATELDPSWQAKVGWDVATLGRAVDVFDIERARS